MATIMASNAAMSPVAPVSSATSTVSDYSHDGTTLHRMSAPRQCRFRAAGKRLFHACGRKVAFFLKRHDRNCPHALAHIDRRGDPWLQIWALNRYPQATCCCKICGEATSDHDMLRTRSCKHVVCRQCASVRMLDGIFSCPVCRRGDQLSRAGDPDHFVYVSDTRWWPRV